MMNKGKIIAILTALAMTICINPVLASAQDVTASSASKNEYDMAFSSEDMEITDKMIFAERMHQKHEAARVKGETTEKSTEEIYHLMEQISFARLNSDEKTAKEYETELEKCGVYVYTRGEIIIPAQNQEDAVAPASIWYPDSSASDVIMNAPSIYHNVNDDNWIISCGGSWRNDNWCPYIPETTGYLGEADAFGVGYTSAKTPYSSSVVSSYASIVDQRNQYITSTQYRSDGDGSKGFGFRLRDEVKCMSSSDVRYIGYSWFGSCTYDSNFAKFDAIATAYYTHTYSNANIDSISFGVEGKTGGVNVVIKNSSVGWTAYSSDTTLNNYGK